MTAILFSQTIGPVAIDVFVKEQHKFELGITTNPIETGAEVNDHAYVKPKRVTLDVADGAAAETYNALVRFSESRVPFSIVTGLFVYSNMLILSGNFARDATYANVANGQVELQEVIIVDTAYAAGDFGDDPVNESMKDNKGRQSRPSSSKAGDAATANRTSGTVHRGDMPHSVTPSTTPANKSVLSRVFG